MVEEKQPAPVTPTPPPATAPARPAPTSPQIERLRLDVEQAKLEKELAEHSAGRATALIGDWSTVTAPTDTVTASQDDPTGLADVHVSRAALNVADDIADLVWTALNAHQLTDAEILVVGSPDVIADCDSYQVVRSGLTQMLDRVRASGSAADPPAPGPATANGTESRLLFSGLATMIPAITSALPAMAGVVSKLLSRAYTVSGKATSGLDDFGFDLQLAHEVLHRASTATVRVGRLTPVPSTALFADVRQLAMTVQGSLGVRLATAEARLALHAERAKQAQASLDAARSQIVELVKLLTAQDGDAAGPAPSELAARRVQADVVRVELLQVRAELRQSAPEQEAGLIERIADLEGQLAALREQIGRAVTSLSDVEDTSGASPRTEALARALDAEDRLVERLPGLRAAEAATTAARDELKHLRDDALALLGELLTGSPDVPPPLIRAGRIESLLTAKSTEPQVILMARVLRAGVDRVLETKVGPEQMAVLAGVTVEWALLLPTGKMLDCGVRSGLRVTEGPLAKLAELQSHDVLYVGVPKRSEQRPATSPSASR